MMATTMQRHGSARSMWVKSNKTHAGARSASALPPRSRKLHPTDLCELRREPAAVPTYADRTSMPIIFAARLHQARCAPIIGGRGGNSI